MSLQIYFYNYYILKRASDLLAGGSVLNQSLQPHESHVPFELQFLMDYNLQGMNLIHLRHVLFRQVDQSPGFIIGETDVIVGILRHGICYLFYLVPA